MNPKMHNKLLRLAGLASVIALGLALFAATAHATPPPPASSEPSIGKAPHLPGSFERTSPSAPAAPAAAGSAAFGIDIVATNRPLYRWPHVDAPGSWTHIGTTGLSLPFAGDFVGDDSSVLYVIDDQSQELYEVDTATSAATLVGPCILVTGQHWSGMAWDPTTSTMFASAANGSTATLFTLDLATGAATPVGPITDAPYTVGIAVNGEGEMYGLDMLNDNLIAIDKATGAATVVGPIGFNANYAQGMDFDPQTGVLYLAAYNLSSGGELRTANTSTGATTLVGPFPGGAEVDAFAIGEGMRPIGGFTTPSGLPRLARVAALVVAAAVTTAGALALRRRLA
jgi:hypothetical protein